MRPLNIVMALYIVMMSFKLDDGLFNVDGLNMMSLKTK
jgi:hypothetical protein